MSDPCRLDDCTLYRALEAADIDYALHEHPAVFTVAESTQLYSTLPEGLHIKNLFLRDRKKNFFLISLQDDVRVNLKTLGGTLGARGGLSFANPGQLWDMLGVRPGSVTPYAILNSQPGSVRQLFDETLFQSRYFHAHPLRNDRTITAETQRIAHWLATQNYSIERLDFRRDPPHIVPT